MKWLLAALAAVWPIAVCVLLLMRLEDRLSQRDAALRLDIHLVRVTVESEAQALRAELLRGCAGVRP